MHFLLFSVLKRPLFLVIGLLIACLQNAQSEEMLPNAVKKSLQLSKIPESGLAFQVLPLGKNSQSPISWRANIPMNPASTMKLLTTTSALEILGPQYRWKTQVYGTGTLENGVYTGNLIWKGSGDPKFVPEELSPIMANLRDQGINEINGQLIFDRSAYSPSVKNTAPLDGESSRTYNVTPDPLLYAFQTLSFKITSNGGQPEISYTPHLAGLHVINQLQPSKGSCGDWTKTVKTSIRQINENEYNASFIGKFSVNCGEVNWNIVTIEANQFLKQGIMAAWEDAGGKWKEAPQASSGTLPNGAKLLVNHQGILLSDAVKDTNKYSNNVMARQIFLTLGLEKGTKPVTTNESTRIVKEWLRRAKLDFPELVIENGSGLSNIERISPQSMTSLLKFAVQSKNADALVNSLPIAGVDGTMKHRLIDRLRNIWKDNTEENVFTPDMSMPSTLQKTGAYMKTGTLQTVRAVGGYVVSKTGKVYAVSSIVNHANAQIGGSTINDALLAWVLEDCPDN
jgi:D-alanyl-D-alanine carboxypeptidase/D-alanyl-D-alanine-endopeptidase (penicillin-binding protein 4)